jgi:hypothetical protein
MQNPARYPFAVMLFVLLPVGAVGCTAETGPPLATCSDVMPEAIVADIFGDNTLVRLDSAESDAITPLLDEIATEGVACGSDDPGSAIVIGQLAMDNDDWISTRDAFAADGYQVDLGYPLPGAVSLTKGGNPVLRQTVAIAAAGSGPSTVRKRNPTTSLAPHLPADTGDDCAGELPAAQNVRY